MRSLTRSIAACLLGAALLACTTSAPGHGSALAADGGVPLELQLPQNPSDHVKLSPEACAAIADTLSAFNNSIANASIAMRGLDINPYLSEEYTARLAEFSLSLTLKNGSRLSSKRRKVPQGKLGGCIQECIRQCMAQYQKRANDEDPVLNLTNL